MNLTKSQQRVVDAMIEGVERRKRVTVYAGPGGTGKTVVAAEICRELLARGYNPVPCTMVGKAAARLQTKLDAAGLDLRVTTISALVERVFTTDDGPRFTAKDANLPRKSVLFIDEMSMVGARYMKTRLLPGTRGVPIIGCGDPFQIPPVMDTSTGLLEATPHRLTKVHRQAKHSPVLRLASAVRSDEVYFYTPDDPDILEAMQGVRSFAKNPGLAVVPAVNWLAAVLSTYPVDGPIPDAPVLAFTNAEVDRINRAVRSRYGLRSDLPAEGEIIRATRNNPTVGVYNGEHYRVVEVIEHAKADGAVRVALDGNGGSEVWLPLDPAAPRWKPETDVIAWDWGYSTTVHRAQGSEWPHVRMLIGKRAAALSASVQGRRLLYTGITRASKQLDLIVVDYDYVRKVAKLNNRLRTRVRARLRRAALREAGESGKTIRKPRGKSAQKGRRSKSGRSSGGLDLSDLFD